MRDALHPLHPYFRNPNCVYEISLMLTVTARWLLLSLWMCSNSQNERREGGGEEAEEKLGQGRMNIRKTGREINVSNSV